MPKLAQILWHRVLYCVWTEGTGATAS